MGARAWGREWLQNIIQNQLARLTAMIPKETLWRFMGLLGRRFREPKKIRWCNNDKENHKKTKKTTS